MVATGDISVLGVVGNSTCSGSTVLSSVSTAVNSVVDGAGDSGVDVRRVGDSGVDAVDAGAGVPFSVTVLESGICPGSFG